MVNLHRSTRPTATRDTLVLLTDPRQLKDVAMDAADRRYLASRLQGEDSFAVSDAQGRLVMVHRVKAGDRQRQLELARRAGSDMADRLNAAKATEAQLIGLANDPALSLSLAEGVALASYTFRKYKSNGAKKHDLEKLHVIDPAVDAEDLEELNILCSATCTARDLVNEPVSFLTAPQLSAELRTLGKACGFQVQVLDKRQIEALGMGGLLAVNKGSIDPPTFNVLEWKPKKPLNKAPVVLIGKGVVYDTGGLSLKPTPHSMDYMKCDMAGAAAVAGAFAAIAQLELPLHVVGLIPATDNRPGGNAFAPGDVIRMHSGATVEVMNSDAEGRMILADALSYAERYKPEVVVTIATLTGAAARAIGTQGSVIMGTAPDNVMAAWETAGAAVHERLARMPFWEEYDSEIDSDIADMKNLGGDLAGQITAGKFLARFTTHPFVHLDIAGTAFLHKREHYRLKGGTGVGVRLFLRYLKNLASR
ncbi:MAG: leucyl aminopeptidase [Flavobacteriales bacterium]|nr:leucyl aminopeptidase [Flavobacteriales bacterium]